MGAEAEADWGCAKGVGYQMYVCTEYLVPYPEIIRTRYNHEQLAANEATDDSVTIRPIFTCKDRT